MPTFEDKLLDELKPLVEQDWVDVPTPRTKWRLPRFAWRIAIAGTLAVGLLVAGVVVRDDGGSRPETLTAAMFLERAAAAVEHQNDEPIERPRDDQWIYLKTFSDSETLPGRWDQERWLRFDGKGSWLPPGKVAPLVIWDYNPAEAWDQWESLPRDPEALLDTIYAEVDKKYDSSFWQSPEARANRAMALIGELLGSKIGLTPPPDLQAALYRALALIPDIKIIEDATDLAGRDAVLVLHTVDTVTEGVALDPITYDYLGSASELDGRKVTGGTAVEEAKIVDKPGER